MKMFHVKRQLLALFMPGFLLGILYVNLEAEQFAAGAGIFSEYFFETIPGGRYSDGRVYLVFAAGPSFAVFSTAGICFYKIQKSGSYSVLDLDGFSAGLLFSMAVLGMGVKGSILCIAGMLPQFLCYIPAYLIVVWYAYCYPRMQWNIQKSLVSGGLLLVGIVLELYVNPVLVGAFLKTL